MKSGVVYISIFFASFGNFLPSLAVARLIAKIPAENEKSKLTKNP